MTGAYNQIILHITFCSSPNQGLHCYNIIENTNWTKTYRQYGNTGQTLGQKCMKSEASKTEQSLLSWLWWQFWDTFIIIVIIWAMSQAKLCQQSAEIWVNSKTKFGKQTCRFRSCEEDVAPSDSWTGDWTHSIQNYTWLDITDVQQELSDSRSIDRSTDCLCRLFRTRSRRKQTKPQSTKTTTSNWSQRGCLGVMLSSDLPPNKPHQRGKQILVWLNQTKPHIAV